MCLCQIFVDVWKERHVVSRSVQTVRYSVSDQSVRRGRQVRCGTTTAEHRQWHWTVGHCECIVGYVIDSVCLSVCQFSVVPLLLIIGSGIGLLAIVSAWSLMSFTLSVCLSVASSCDLIALKCSTPRVNKDILFTLAFSVHGTFTVEATVERISKINLHMVRCKLIFKIPSTVASTVNVSWTVH